MNTRFSSSAQAVTLLRVALGTMYLAHAWLKWQVFSLPGTAAYFESVGLPGVFAYLVFAAEVAGGIALVAGIYARQIALLLSPILLGAVWVHAPNGWVFNATGGGWEYPLFLALVSVALWLLGDGAFAVRRGARLVPQGQAR